MSSITTTGSLPQALIPGIRRFFGDEYNRHPMQFMEVFEKASTNRAYEDEVEMINLGYAPEKKEGSATKYTAVKQGTTYRTGMVPYSLGVIITKEALADNLYMGQARIGSKKIARAMAKTKNVVGAALLNRGFDSAYARADGVELFSAAHPDATGGTQSNLLAADLSHAALQDAVILARKTNENDGTPVENPTRKLIVPEDLSFVATTLLESIQRSGTANNDINDLREQNVFPDGVATLRYLTNQSAWFIKNDLCDATYYERTAIEVGEDLEFDSGNVKVKAYERYAFSINEFRGFIGSLAA